MDVTKVVKGKLTILNMVVAFTSIIGVFSVLELRNGVHLHELNFAHLSYSKQFEQRLKTTDLGSHEQVDDLKTLVSLIRDQPVACLEHRNFATTFGTKILGTYHTFILCEQDLIIADRALKLLDMINTGEVDQKTAMHEIEAISANFNKNSADFSVPVATTVSALLLLMLIIMLAKGGTAIILVLVSSRSILKHVKHASRMEDKLHEKNTALGHSITVLKRQKQEIDIAMQLAEHNSRHDPLTNLPNRRYLDDKIIDIEADGEGVALLHLDIDRFKQINDTKGHEAGDYILVHVAQTLKSLLRKQDFVARIGGDEFVILVKLTRSGNRKQQIDRLADRITRSLNDDIIFDDQQCRLSVSVGGALPSGYDGNIKSLFTNADIALYRAKSDGRNRYEIYREGLKNTAIRRKFLADEVVVALEKQEIIPFYQLQFHPQTLDVLGMEALARWEHPSRGLISPGEFMPIAMELGVLGDIDKKILEQAVFDLAALEKEGFYIPRVSVNISGQRLHEPNFINDLMKLNLPKDRVAFELLESVLLDNADDQLKWTMESIRELGIQLEIDDFGSGHASILGLLSVRPNRFKIDGQIIRDIVDSPNARSLIKSIVDIGRSLDIEVLAEGIETSRHIDEIRKLDCDGLQGFALAIPMAFKDVQTFLQHENWRLSVA